MVTPPKNAESKASIIEAVKTPLGLAALVVLLIEGILGILAAKATGTDFTILVVAMPVILLALIAFAFFARSGPPAQASTPEPAKEQAAIKHDVFLSSPMAAFSSDAAYKQNRKDVLTMAKAFREECKFESVVFAGNEIESMDDFEAADLSAEEDILALTESKYFVLHYSERIASSVLFEAGVALALKKPTLYFVKDREHLPFLMRQAEQAFPKYVKIYECPTVDKIVELIKNHREKLFPHP